MHHKSLLQGTHTQIHTQAHPYTQAQMQTHAHIHKHIQAWAHILHYTTHTRATPPPPAKNHSNTHNPTASTTPAAQPASWWSSQSPSLRPLHLHPFFHPPALPLPPIPPSSSSLRVPPCHRPASTVLLAQVRPTARPLPLCPLLHVRLLSPPIPPHFPC